MPRGLGLMVATGFSICGASAIVAMDSVARTRKEEVATAVTLVTIYGSVAIAIVPFLGSRVFGLDPETLGMWAGLSVHEVAQVVAAASPAGAAAVGTAVIVKLTRVVPLAAAMFGLGTSVRVGALLRTGRRGLLLGLLSTLLVGALSLIALTSTGPTSTR